MIESAYRLAEACGIPVWCQDEAGPYQAIPQSGAGWFPHGDPGRQPHEYVRGGTAKLLTLFCPATGEVRARGGDPCAERGLASLVTSGTGRDSPHPAGCVAAAGVGFLHSRLVGTTTIADGSLRRSTAAADPDLGQSCRT